MAPNKSGLLAPAHGFLKILQCPDFENLWGDFWHLFQPKKLDESDGGFFFLRIIFSSHVLFHCPPPKMSKCRPVSKFFQKKLEYPDCPPPKISKRQTSKENSDT